MRSSLAAICVLVSHKEKGLMTIQRGYGKLAQCKISLITVCFNSERTIRRCLDSVLMQTVPVFEHIIIDGASSDKTLALVNERYPTVRYATEVVSERDRGVYDAMNKGLAIAKGDYVWFLNSDDVLSSAESVSKVTKGLALDHPVGIAGHTSIKSEQKVVKTYYAKRLKWAYQQPHPSILLNTGFLAKHGIIFDSSYAIAADYKMQLEVLKHSGEIKLIDDVLADMYIGGVSTGTWGSRVAGLLESRRAFNEVFGSGGTINTIRKVLTKYGKD